VWLEKGCVIEGELVMTGIKMLQDYLQFFLGETEGLK